MLNKMWQLNKTMILYTVSYKNRILWMLQNLKLTRKSFAVPFLSFPHLSLFGMKSVTFFVSSYGTMLFECSFWSCTLNTFSGLKVWIAMLKHQKNWNQIKMLVFLHEVIEHAHTQSRIQTVKYPTVYSINLAMMLSQYKHTWKSFHQWRK